MALDIQIPYRGDQYLFQGISGGASSFAGGAERAIQKYKQTQDAGKAADAAVKAWPQMLEQMGIHPEAFKTLSAQDKASKVMGFMQGQGAQMERQQTEARTKETQARTALLMMQQQEEMGNQDFMKELNTMMGGAPTAGTGTSGGYPADSMLHDEPASGMITRTGGAPVAGFDPRAVMGGGMPAPATPGFNPAELMSPGAGAAGQGPVVDPRAFMGGAASAAPAMPAAGVKPEMFMSAAQRVAQRNPAFMRSKMFQQIMLGQGNDTPKDFVSPDGTAFTYYHGQLQQHKKATDIAGMIANVPKGQKGVQTGPNTITTVPDLKPPADFHTQMGKFNERIVDAQQTLRKSTADFKDAAEEKKNKGFAQADLDVAMRQAKFSIDQVHEDALISDERRDKWYKEFGLEPPGKAGGAAKPGAGDGGPPTLKSGDKAAYDKLPSGAAFYMDGKLYRKP